MELCVETNSVSCVYLECVKQVVTARMSMLVLWQSLGKQEQKVKPGC
jgi:hypothetical protein